MDEDHEIPAMTIDELVRTMRESGSEYVTRQTIQADIAAGAPVNPDGTVDPVAYAAWLLAQVK